MLKAKKMSELDQPMKSANLTDYQESLRYSPLLSLVSW